MAAARWSRLPCYTVIAAWYPIHSAARARARAGRLFTRVARASAAKRGKMLGQPTPCRDWDDTRNSAKGQGGYLIVNQSELFMSAIN